MLLHLLKTGNEPVRMFRELATLGELTVTADLQGVPDLYQLDPEECHLSWKLDLRGYVPVNEIDDIFDWVEDDCDLAKQALFSETQFISEQPTVIASSVDSLPADNVPTPGHPEPILPPKQPKKEEAKPASKGSSSIRVDTRKIDTLINNVKSDWRAF